MEDRFQELERAIARTEDNIAGCEQGLLTFVSAEETQRLSQQLDQKKSELQKLLREWEQVGQVLQD